MKRRWNGIRGTQKKKQNAPNKALAKRRGGQSPFFFQNFVRLHFVPLSRRRGGGGVSHGPRIPGGAGEWGCGDAGGVAAACRRSGCPQTPQCHQRSRVPSLLLCAAPEPAPSSLGIFRSRLCFSRRVPPDGPGARVSSAVGVLPTSRGKHGLPESYLHTRVFFFT